MHAAFTDEQKDLRRSVHEALATLCPPGALRAVWSDRAALGPLWQGIVDLGLLGVMVRAESGGLGLDARDAVMLAWECGYVGVPGPFVDNAWAAAPLLDELGETEALEKLLGGHRRIVACSDALALVADLDLAEQVLVLNDGPGFWTPREAIAESSVDGARKLFRMNGVDGGRPVDPLLAEAAADRGTLGSAAFQLGLGQRMLDLTLDYAKVRQQFGRLIGSYQAVQHHLANAAVALSFAMPLLSRAACSLAVGHPDAAVHVSMAHLRAAAAAEKAGRAALQVHGAIGYTTEHDLHLFLKRAWALKKAWGDENFHRQRIAVALERRPSTKEYWDV